MWIIGIGHDAVEDCLHSILIHASYRSVIFYAEKQMPALPVQKGTHGFKSILVELGFRGFEFNGNPFALVDDMLEEVCFHLWINR